MWKNKKNTGNQEPFSPFSPIISIYSRTKQHHKEGHGGPGVTHLNLPGYLVNYFKEQGFKPQPGGYKHYNRVTDGLVS